MFTVHGFYSAVEYDPAKAGKKDRKRWGVTTAGTHVIVRCRVEDDIKNLVAITRTEYDRSPSADYLFRTVMTKERWAGFCAAQADAVDYPNFKNRVSKTQGKERASVYNRVWGAVSALQPTRPWSAKPWSGKPVQGGSASAVELPLPPWEDESAECYACGVPHGAVRNGVPEVVLDGLCETCFEFYDTVAPSAMTDAQFQTYEQVWG